MAQVALIIVTASALFLINLQPALAQFYFDGYESLPEKKSHQGMADFTNALNGAARLRYGKRSPPSTQYGYNPEERAADWIPRFQSSAIAAAKRSPSASMDSIPQFLQSLNGAERLRFG